jgi:hypothetical protein
MLGALGGLTLVCHFVPDPGGILPIKTLKTRFSGKQVLI